MSSRHKSEREQDEDLLLFREMFKRERERNMSLLQPESVELEPGQGTYLLHKFPSGRKDFHSTESSKNDYDWLKTPPATPLFPSLEMDANQPNMVFHREIPLLHPFKPSRFRGKSEEAKPAPKSPNSKSTSSSQSVTPKKGSDFSSGQTSLGEEPLISIAKLKQSTLNSKKKSNSPAIIANPVEEHPVRTAAPEKHNSDNRHNPNTGASSLVRSRTAPTIPGFSDRAPSNLITNASAIPAKVSSITRGPKLENGKLRKQPCSPSAARDKKVDFGADGVQNLSMRARNNATKEPSAGDSRMAEKVMNARRVASANKNPKPKEENGAWKSNARFGKFNSRPSHENAFENMDDKNTPGEINRLNLRHVKNSYPAPPRPAADSSHQMPNKEVKSSRGQVDKYTPKAGTFFRRVKTE